MLHSSSYFGISYGNEAVEMKMIFKHTRIALYV
jgi:hypothetical protein